MPITSLTSTASIEISVLFLAFAVVFIIGMSIAFSYPAIECEQQEQRDKYKPKLENHQFSRSRSLYSDTSYLYSDTPDCDDSHDRRGGCDIHDHHGGFLDVD